MKLRSASAVDAPAVMAFVLRHFFPDAPIIGPLHLAASGGDAGCSPRERAMKAAQDDAWSHL